MKLFLIFTILIIHIQLFAQLIEINDFGRNPGNLRSYVYLPKDVSSMSNLPLVVALHGCTQDAIELATESGWNELADKYGFIVLYPEQKKVNNATACFNWFSKSDIRFNGESKSILEMIKYVESYYSIDSSRIFSYGLSAGAAMSTALLAQYPETFKSGAVLAGGPYGIATNALQAYGVMKDGGKSFGTPTEWAKPVKDLHIKTKHYPAIIIVHGQEDKTVNPINARNLINQWIGLHPEINQDPFPKLETISNSILVEKYSDTLTQEVIVKYYSINNLGHQVPVDPGNEQNQGGKTGTYAKDVDFFSTYYIAKDFGLIHEEQSSTSF